MWGSMVHIGEHWNDYHERSTVARFPGSDELELKSDPLTEEQSVVALMEFLAPSCRRDSMEIGLVDLF